MYQKYKAISNETIEELIDHLNTAGSVEGSLLANKLDLILKDEVKKEIFNGPTIFEQATFKYMLLDKLRHSLSKAVMSSAHRDRPYNNTYPLSRLEGDILLSKDPDLFDQGTAVYSTSPDQFYVYFDGDHHEVLIDLSNDKAYVRISYAYTKGVADDWTLWEDNTAAISSSWSTFREQLEYHF